MPNYKGNWEVKSCVSIILITVSVEGKYRKKQTLTPEGAVVMSNPAILGIVRGVLSVHRGIV